MKASVSFRWCPTSQTKDRICRLGKTVTQVRQSLGEWSHVDVRLKVDRSERGGPSVAAAALQLCARQSQ